MADVQQAESFETATKDNILSSEDFPGLHQAIARTVNELKPFSTSKPDKPEGADVAVKLRALVEVHGAREEFYFSDPQTKSDLQALLPGLDEVGFREFVRKFVQELNQQQMIASTTSTDRDTLIALFRSTCGANWNRKDNWDTDAELSTWHGVRVNDKDRVVELSLAENNLQGAIPSELGDLRELAYLDLSSNDLCGPIPKELGTLTQLEELMLHNNHLEGPVPEKLTGLRIYDKTLTGDKHSFMADLQQHVESFEAAANDKTLSSEDFLRLGQAVARAQKELPPLTASDPGSPQGADIVVKLRALVEVHGTREEFYFSDLQTKADLRALLPGLDEVEIREFVREFVQELNQQQYAQALPPLERAVSLRMKKLVGDDTDTADSQRSLEEVRQREIRQNLQDSGGVPFPHLSGGQGMGMPPMGAHPTTMKGVMAPKAVFCPPPAGTTAIVADKVKADKWSEYTDDNGEKYYHNPARPEDTTWDKPEDFDKSKNAGKPAPPTRPSKKKSKYKVVTKGWL